MRTFVLLLSCLVCCATAGHYGLAQKLLHLNNVRTGQKGYTSVGTDQRQHQEFLLDVLLQVQKPLVNNQLVQLGQELVTDPNMYLLSSDEILQQFLQQAENREVIGRNGVYNPVDISNIRQLVGLQRFFVLARDFNVFQRNVVYARLYFNPVMFVDALSLAIRDRPDTQDLVLPPVNEILPQLYYDNYVLNYAQNIDYSGLISQEARANVKSSIFDIFGLRRIGSLFQLGNYGNYNPLQQRYSAHRYGFGRFGIAPVNSKENGGEYVVEGSYIQEKIVVPVEGRDGTDLTNDVDLNVAWNNIVIDQLVQAVTEGVEGGQQYAIGSNGLPQVDVGSPRLSFVGRRRRVDNGGYSAYVNPFYGQQNQYGYNDQEYARHQYKSQQYGYTGPEYSYDRQQNQAGQYNYKGNDYSYGRQQKQGPLYGYKGKEYYYARQQNQGSHYDQQNHGSQYGYDDNQYSYGRQQNQGSQYGYNSYGQQNHGSQYGYKDNEYSYGRQQNRGSQYGYNSYGQQNHGSQYGYKDNEYSYGHQQNRGYGYNSYGEQQKGSQYGSYYGIPYGRQPYQGSQYGYEDQQYYYGGQPNQGAKYSYNHPVYSSSYYNPYGRQQYNYKNYEYQYEPRIQQQDQYQGQQQQQTYRVFPYGPQEVVNTNVGDDVVVIDRVVRDTHNRGQSGKRYNSDEGKRVSYRNAEQYRELEGLHEGIIRSIDPTQQVSYIRRGEILLQSIQELAARLNIQRIVETLEGSIYQQQHIQHVQQEVDQIIQQIRALVEQIREEAGISEGSERTLHIVADIIGGRIVLEQQQQLSIDVKRTLQELQQQIQRIVGNQVGQVNEVTPLVLLFGSLRSPVTQQTILSLAQLIDDYRQKLQPYTSSQLSGNGDIKVQNVQIDPLVTYTEVVDVDLVNMIDQQLLQSNANNLQQLGQKVVARQQRLNYQPFTISLDIESQHQQEVAIRVLLAPQVDSTGRRVSLAQNRKNFVLIDTYVQQLQAGVNNIERNSRQFNGYNSEVCTISQIYHQIMTGQINVQSGVTRQLPRNLLLPRGSANGGLPVQIMVVVTPLNQQAELLHVEARQISGLGIAAVGVDQLPLNYPLDRQIVDGQHLDVPNIQLVETVIQYDSRRSALDTGC
ncbi:PREDICTED: fat-body protein 1-like isoform X2 [Bactrocera latifrons]|uniref:Larval serum protein 1 gamma chain n=1 Tax=Bactrocera latifrons TaxID=174628 RepID=A0A0K8VPC0_BACLA|nr:PREDICTED: fat-body protein 1-like isoform X2 [Bactrocera latifrons]